MFAIIGVLPSWLIDDWIGQIGWLKEPDICECFEVKVQREYLSSRETPSVSDHLLPVVCHCLMTFDDGQVFEAGHFSSPPNKPTNPIFEIGESRIRD